MSQRLKSSEAVEMLGLSAKSDEIPGMMLLCLKFGSGVKKVSEGGVSCSRLTPNYRSFSSRGRDFTQSFHRFKNFS